MSDRVPAECPSCGKVFAVAASFAGKKIRCPQCQGIIQIAGNSPSPPPAPRSSSSGSTGAVGSSPASRSEPRVARPVKSEDPPAARSARPASSRPAAAKPESRPTRSAPARKKRSNNYDEEQPWGDMDSDDPANDPYADNSYGSPSALPPRSKKGGAAQKYKAETTQANSGGGTDGSVIVGILMMVGAVVWFFGGLAFGYIFYYPPVLFVLGLISTIKGALNLGK